MANGKLPDVLRYCPICGQETFRADHVCDFDQDCKDLVDFDVLDSCEDD